jgi:hypothetical protein
MTLTSDADCSRRKETRFIQYEWVSADGFCEAISTCGLTDIISARTVFKIVDLDC